MKYVIIILLISGAFFYGRHLGFEEGVLETKADEIMAKTLYL